MAARQFNLNTVILAAISIFFEQAVHHAIIKLDQNNDILVRVENTQQAVLKKQAEDSQRITLMEIGQQHQNDLIDEHGQRIEKVEGRVWELEKKVKQ